MQGKREPGASGEEAGGENASPGHGLPAGAPAGRWLGRWLRPGFASECAICRAWPAQPVCADCARRFAPAVARCTTCAALLPAGLRSCGRCLRHPPALQACFAAVPYGYPWSECIARFKFRHEPGWAGPLAGLLHAVAGVAQALEQADWVLPVPLAPLRLRERGYNQAFELARRLAPRQADARLLLRIRETHVQNELTREERQRNVDGAFAVDPLRQPGLRGRRIVLVDDVMTSGASLFAAAEALRAAGAAHVAGLVVARTDDGLS